MARRLAAILAADVVGYSRLMAADEKGTHARLKALRQDFLEPKVSEHHGRLVKLMGDGALSGSTSTTLSSKATTSTAMASTSRPALRASPSRGYARPGSASTSRPPSRSRAEMDRAAVAVVAANRGGVSDDGR
jgi:class 3 adenylate cyclase